ncbi:hypothetical protein, partial [Fibrobacter sp. UWCM]|uniref:hypothetical protein n=1 Tax=Fibrobacter sp. UWCM TaxID=1896208 RepID=UPI001C318328
VVDFCHCFTFLGLRNEYSSLCYPLIKLLHGPKFFFYQTTFSRPFNKDKIYFPLDKVNYLIVKKMYKLLYGRQARALAVERTEEENQREVRQEII